MPTINLNDPHVQAAIIQAAATLAVSVYKPGMATAEKIALHAAEITKELAKISGDDPEISDVSIG